MENCDKGPQLERIEAKLDKMTELIVDNAEIHQTLHYQATRIESVEKKVESIQTDIMKIKLSPAKAAIAVCVGVTISVAAGLLLDAMLN